MTTRRMRVEVWGRVGLTLAALAALAASCTCDGGGPGEVPPGADAGPGEAKEADRLQEVEPNDAPDQATPFIEEATAPGSLLLRPMRGELSGAGDVDWYRLRGEPKALMRSLEVKPEGGQGDLVLLWGARDAAQNLAPPGEPERIPNLGLGEVLIGVRAEGAASLRYTLDLKRLPARSTPDVEEGPEGAEISASAPGDLQGLINFSGDLDVFKVDLSGLKDRSVLGVEVRGPGITAEIGPWNGAPQLTLQAATGEVASIPNLGIAEGTSALRVAVRAQDASRALPDAWTVRLIAPPPPPEGVTLEVEGLPQPQELAAAPGVQSYPAGAGHPAGKPPGARAQGYLHDLADQDAFTWTLPPLERPGLVYVVSATLEGGREDDLLLRYTLPSGTQGEVSAGGPGAGERLCNVLPGPGVIRLEVARAAADPAADPAPLQARYTLRLESRIEEGVEVESNDIDPHATPLPAPGAQVIGWLSIPEDVDLYALEVRPGEAPAPPPKPQGEGGGLSRALDRLVDAPPGEDDAPPAPVHVEVEIETRGLIVEAALLDPDGIALVTRRQQIAGDPLQLVADVPPGRYLVRVRDAGGDRASCDGGYTVRWITP